MLKKNIGPLDRILRVIVGAALIAGWFAYPDASWRWAFLLGIVPLATGLVASCPLYSILGISTCKPKDA